jgi:Zn-dependent metalloprotease
MHHYTPMCLIYDIAKQLSKRRLKDISVIQLVFAIFLVILPTKALFGFRAEEEKTTPSARSRAGHSDSAIKSPSQTQIAAATAAKSEGLDIQWSSKTGTPNSIRGGDLAKPSSFSAVSGINAAKYSHTMNDRAIGVMSNLSQIYGIKDTTKEFKVSADIESDKLGFQHVRMTQVYNGLRVVGGDLRVHFNSSGIAYQVTGSYVKDVTPELATKLTEDDAIAIAKSELVSRGFTQTVLQRAPEIVVYAIDVPKPAISYEIILRTTDSVKGEEIFRCWIDARNGDVLNVISEIMTIAAPTSSGFSTTISGNLLTGEGGASVSLQGWKENFGNYYLYNKLNLWYIYNASSSSLYSDFNTYAFRPMAAWGASDPTEISAARNMDMVQAYFRNVHLRNSINGNGMYARADVHFGNNYVNAYWDGSKMVFGDGDGVTATSLAVLDVAAHEVTHGITQYTANLIYANESGALNESFSDIFGTIIEFYAQSDGRIYYPNTISGAADWLMGEDCWKSSKALRDMRNPSSTVTLASGAQQPSRYKGTYWYYGGGDNGGVHCNSGVQNFFFYLLCEGGSGSNDGVSYSVAGIGMNNARQVAYRALTVYCTSTTDYAGVRDAWIAAAQDLNPTWVTSVQAAWNAVGVGAVVAGVQSPSFSPPAGSYQSAINVTISSATAGATIHYTLDGSEPTELSPSYTTPLNIRTRTILKAKAYKSGLQPSSTTSATYQFLGTALYSFSMDSSPAGWTASGLWGYGPPTGRGGAHGYPDPSNGYTGVNVYGYNLGGDYQDNLASTQWLTTSALNLANASNVQLGFWRRLGVETPSYDHAYIEVSNNGTTWTRIWENTTEITDSQWTYVTYDISTIADHQNTVYIRWGIGPTDSSWTYCGWNIDDVQIFGTNTGPSVPSVPTNLSVSAGSSSTVQISWQDTSNNEQGFAIERKLGALGSWSEIGRVGANVTSYTDSGLTSSATYTYRCRSYNSGGYSAYSTEGTVTTPSSGGDSWDPNDNNPVGATLLYVPSSTEQIHGQHRLSDTDFADWFKVLLTAGVRYNFNSAGGSGDNYGELYSDSAGNVLVANDDDSAGGLQFSLSFTPLTTGYYYLKVRAYSPGQPATYNLKYSGNINTSTRIISVSGNLAFGNVAIGNSVTSIFTISNSGNSVLTVSSITYPPGFSGNWSSGTIAPGATKSVLVTFTPTSATSSGGTVTVFGDQTAGPNTITASGTGVGTLLNDAFLSATIIPFNGIYTGSNNNATKEANEPNHANINGGKSVWWRWNAPVTGQCTINTSGSGFDTLLAVYTGTSVGALTLVASNDDSSGVDRTSRVTFNAIQGTTYQIAVDGFGGASGSISLNLGQINSSPSIMALRGNLAFGKVRIGKSKTKIFKIYNKGDLAITISSITFPPGFGGSWSSGTIQPHRSLPVRVTFTPTSATSISGSVAVFGDQTDGVSYISASGSGIAVRW